MLADAILRPLKRLLRRGLSQAGSQVVRTSTNVFHDISVSVGKLGGRQACFSMSVPK
jgi:hypothetical protein